MNKMLFCGELVIGTKGIVYHRDLAEALQVERLTSIPKELPEMGTIALVVGRFLGGREPSIVAACKAKNIPSMSVAEVLNDAAAERLIVLLKAKPKLEKFEQAAIDHLLQAKKPEPSLEVPAELPTRTGTAPESKKRRGKKSTDVANG